MNTCFNEKLNTKGTQNQHWKAKIKDSNKTQLCKTSLQSQTQQSLILKKKKKGNNNSYWFIGNNTQFTMRDSFLDEFKSSIASSHASSKNHIHKGSPHFPSFTSTQHNTTKQNNTLFSLIYLLQF